jgi:lipoyl(octanoyl) transferase
MDTTMDVGTVAPSLSAPAQTSVPAQADVRTPSHHLGEPDRHRGTVPTAGRQSDRATPRLQVVRLGTIDYLEAWELQKRLTEARRLERIADTLLLLEHPHTYTLGRRGNYENILLSKRQLAARKIKVYEVDRGGDVTYHGPDQLVGYPILKLPSEYTYVRYIRELERALLLAVRDLGVNAELNEGFSGVWVGNEKVCAIGVKVDAYGVTSHGFALNVNTKLSFFGHIIPCGITDKGVTSLEGVLGRRVSPARVERAVVERVSDVFGLTPSQRSWSRTALIRRLSL